MKHNNRPARICSWLLAVAMVFSLMTGMGINTSVYAAEDTDKTAQSVESGADLAEGTGIQGSDTTAASESTVSEISTQEADGSTPEVSAAVDGQTAETEAVTASWNTYTLSSYSDTDKFLADNTTPLQHVVLRLTFNEDVEITDSSALNDCIFGTNPTLTIMIAGTTADCSIADAGYYRPCTYSTSGKDLIIDIGNCINKDTGAAGFTAMYNGAFTTSGSIKGISVGGTEAASDVNIAETRIPIGIELTKVNGWDTSSVTVNVSHKANVRGMYHFAVYKAVSDAENPADTLLLPVTASAGQMNAYTLTSHAHMWYSMTTSTLASNMVSVLNSNLPTGYTAAVDGSNITVTSPDSADKLRIYMYDDNFIKSNTDTLYLSDPGISFAGTEDSLSGNGHVDFKLNVSDPDNGLAAWAGASKITVDGTPYTLVLKEPSAYTVTTSRGTTYYAYLEKYTNSRGTSYYLDLSSDGIDCSAGQSTKHTINITSTIGNSITQEVTVNNYSAQSFRIRYIDANGNIVISKMYTLDQLKNKFANTTQDYSTVCTMAGVRTFHAEGALLTDILNDAGITLNEDQVIQLRTNDSTSQSINDPGDRVGDITEGYYGASEFDDDGSLSKGSGQFDESDLFAARYYYPSIYDSTSTYSALNGSTVYDSLKTISGQLIRTWGTYADTSSNLRSILASTSDKVAVTPLIAWQYSESVFGSAGSTIKSDFDSYASADKRFRFLFGIKEENDAVATQTTTWSATYECFGIDIIENSAAVKAAKTAISSIDSTVTLSSKTGIDAARTAFNAVPSGDQNKVSNYNVLWAAESAYGILNTKNLISSIGDTITKDSGDAIAAARTAYDALSDTDKAAVTNYDVLTAAEEEYAKTRVENIFTDVDEGDWYQEAVQYVYDNRIMTGLEADIFGPNEILSRGQFVTLLYRMAGSPSVTYSSIFSDVPNGEFYTNAVIWANASRIATGYENGKFGPADSITREQLAVMLYRYAQYKNIPTTETNDFSSFPDGSSVSPFAETAMKWAVGKSLISGDGGKLNPQGIANRAQAAMIIYRLLK